MRALIQSLTGAKPEDLRRGIMGVRLARDILRQPALKPFVVEEISPGPSVVEEPALRDYLRQLAARLRRTRVTCGDFARVLGPSVRQPRSP